VRYVVIFGSAVAGAWTVIIGGLALTIDKAQQHAQQANGVWVLYPLDPVQGRWWVFAAWIGLTLAGVFTQLATTSQTPRRRMKEKMK